MRFGNAAACVLRRTMRVRAIFHLRDTEEDPSKIDIFRQTCSKACLSPLALIASRTPPPALPLVPLYSLAAVSHALVLISIQLRFPSLSNSSLASSIRSAPETQQHGSYRCDIRCFQWLRYQATPASTA